MIYRALMRASANRAEWAARLGLVALASLAACSAPPARSSLASPVEAAQARGSRTPDAAALNRACEGCHEEIAREWRGSLHHQSYSNASFQRAFALEPLAFCQSCHAPAADPTRSAPAILADLGIGCTSCHTPASGGEPDTAILAAGEPEHVTRAPHPVQRSVAFGTNAACAGCHEFAFPDAAQRGQLALMQSTLSEQHTAQDAAACASCHMPRVAPGGHRSHAFAASRDPEFLRRAVQASAERVAVNRVKIELAPRYLGHAFPTGDLFRRLVVEIEAVGPDFRLLSSRQRFLARHFVRKRVAPSLELLELARDDRVGLAGAAASEIELELGPEAVAAPIAWRALYQRVAEPRGVDEANALVEAETELASGWLPALTRSAPAALHPPKIP